MASASLQCSGDACERSSAIIVRDTCKNSYASDAVLKSETVPAFRDKIEVTCVPSVWLPSCHGHCKQ